MAGLAKKLAEAMSEVGYVQKDATNDFHRYRYASAEAVLRKVNAALSSRGVAVATQAELLRYDRVPGSKGGENNVAVVKLALEFTDGEERIHVEGLGSGMDSGDKAVMKANTAALKYAVANAFLISWGDDPEADAATDEEAAKPKAAPTENPFGPDDLDLAAFDDRPRVRKILAGWKGKRGVTELRDLFTRAFGALEWDEARTLDWILKQGIDLENGAKYADVMRLGAALMKEAK